VTVDLPARGTPITDVAAGTAFGSDTPPHSRPHSPRTAKRPRSAASWVLIAVLLAILTFLIVVPVGLLVVGSFLRHPPAALALDFAGAGIANYVAVLSSPGFGGMLLTTFGTAILGTAGAAVIGTVLAWLVTRTDVRARRLISISAMVPMFLSPLVGAFAWDQLASPQSGLINLAIHSIGLDFTFNIYSVPGIAFVFAIYYAPYVYLYVSATLKQMDPILEEASQIVGAGQIRTLFKVTMPLALPAILSSSLLVLVLLIQLFAVPGVLAGPGHLNFISLQIYQLVGSAPPQTNQASALGVLLIIFTVALVILQARLLKGRSYVTVAGKSTQPRQLKLGRLRWFWTVIGLFYVVLAVVLPYVTLIIVGLRKSPYYSTLDQALNPSMFSFAQIGTLFENELVVKSLTNTLVVGVATCAIGIILYFAIAYVVNRTRLPGRGAMSFLSTLPVAIPGIIIGLGYLWSWITLPGGLYGTIWIIVLAYISQFAPQGVGAMKGSMMQIHPELEESSRISGAGPLATIRRVVVPLSRPGTSAAMILLIVLSTRELATALFLYTSQSSILAVTMFNFYQRGLINSMAILAIVQSLVMAALVLLSQLVGRQGRSPVSSGQSVGQTMAAESTPLSTISTKG
jgi:iron(III) transport system permease protein